MLVPGKPFRFAIAAKIWPCITAFWYYDTLLMKLKKWLFEFVVTNNWPSDEPIDITIYRAAVTAKDNHSFLCSCAMIAQAQVVKCIIT